MKVFFDTEFTGLHQNTTLISVGFIADNNQTFYAECTDYDKSQVDSWLEENIINNLLFGKPDTSYPVGIKKPADECIKASSGVIALHLKDWLYDLVDKNNFPYNYKLEVWSDTLSYDWVLFCELFGHAFNIPECVYYIPFDISTLFKIKGIDPDITREDFVNIENSQKHNALYDAKVIKMCYEKLIRL